MNYTGKNREPRECTCTFSKYGRTDGRAVGTIIILIVVAVVLSETRCLLDAQKNALAKPRPRHQGRCSAIAKWDIFGPYTGGIARVLKRAFKGYRAGEGNSKGKVSRGFSRRRCDTRTRIEKPIGAPGYLRSYSFFLAAGHRKKADVPTKMDSRSFQNIQVDFERNPYPSARYVVNNGATANIYSTAYNNTIVSKTFDRCSRNVQMITFDR